MKGLVHIYTGEGKGKTTCSLGLAFRAAGWGRKICIIQFLKGSISGEINSISRFDDNVMIKRMSKNFGFYYNLDEQNKEEFTKEIRDLYNFTRDIVVSDKYDMIILDEILGTLNIGLIAEKEIIEIINSKRPNTELILTGRAAPQSIIDISDYVSEITSVKHPYNTGMPARKGIEY